MGSGDQIARLQRAIVWFALAAVVGTGILATALVMAGFYQHHQEDDVRFADFALDQRVTLLEQHLRRLSEIAAQVSRRTDAQGQLAAYHRGAIGIDELRESSESGLADALRGFRSIASIIRVGREEGVIAEAGHPLPGAVPSASRPPIFDGPLNIGGGLYLQVAEPILDPLGNYQGADLLLFPLSRLLDSLNAAVSPRTRAHSVVGWRAGADIGRLERGGGPAAFETGSEAADLIERSIDGERGVHRVTIDGRPMLAAYTPIPRLRWGLVVLIDPSDFNKPFLESVREASILLSTLLLLAAALSWWSLRWLSDKALVSTALLEEELTTRREMEKALLRSERRFRALVEQSPVSVVITDPLGNIEYVNPTLEQTCGYASAEVIGRHTRLFQSGKSSPEHYRELWRTITRGEVWRGEFLNRKKSGDLYWEYVIISPIAGEDGAIEHFVAVKEEITRQKNHEAELYYRANYDALTDLPNRALALDRLEQAIVTSRRAGKRVAAVLIDLDNFKSINDTLGHALGDEYLVALARRLRSCLRESDTIARLGGDEFLLILSQINEATNAQEICRKIQSELARPMTLDKIELRPRASIGITLFPDDGSDPHILLRNADAAMYQAKAEGRNTYRFFTSAINRQAEKQLLLEVALRAAIRREEFSLAFQPQLALDEGRLSGAEALLRWENNPMGAVPPTQFIPVAEESGLIGEIGAWVLRESCRQAFAWHAGGATELRIAVNVSSRQLWQEDFPAQVAAALDESGLPASALELEITESVLMENAERASEVLIALKQQGVTLALDDFGTGYSSLSYLKRFPFDCLKIDRSFITDCPHDADSRTLTQAIIAMAHHLGISVVAEGVETEAQLAFLRDEGVDLVQGYLYSRPLSADAFGEFAHGEIAFRSSDAAFPLGAGLLATN